MANLIVLCVWFVGATVLYIAMWRQRPAKLGRTDYVVFLCVVAVWFVVVPVAIVQAIVERRREKRL